MSLSYVPAPELERLRTLDADPAARAAAFADACRINALYMIAQAGSGHIGTSFSCMDMLAWLHLEVLEPGDRFFSSKGHDAPALYAVLIGMGQVEFDQIHELRRLGGLPGHPDVRANPEIVTNTGSLGMGVSKAKGFIRADALAEGDADGRVYVLTGDGELQEGQFWESLPGAVNAGIGQVTAIVDHNKIQSDTWVSEVSDLGDLEAKLGAYGWAVTRCDGNDVGAFAEALAELGDAPAEQPRIVVADTLKGAGVSFMEPHDLAVSSKSLYGFHSGAPSADEYEDALGELAERLGRRLGELGANPVALESADRRPRETVGEPAQRLVSAYGEALAELGEEEPRLVALDADLVLDTGLIPFRDRHPERFFECGIAEQDMVSQAGAMALGGLLPVVHSFACFLTPRANEQIYNNATEGTKVIYAGSLVGVVPAGPGHSHQSVRDIALMGSVPGMALIEPCDERQTADAIRWAVHEASGPVYIRLVSVPWPLGFERPEEALRPGQGQIVREGRDGLIVAAGPVLLQQAWMAAERLAERGRSFGVMVLPWLRDIDPAPIAAAAGDGLVVCLDNHYLTGGQGEAVTSAISDAGLSVPVLRVGLTEVPACGTNGEALQSAGLDAASITTAIERRLETPE